MFDMKSIEGLDKSLDERLKKVNVQNQAIDELGKKAKEIVDTMWHVIDDKKAQKMFFELKGEVLEKAKSISSYLKNDLLNDIENVAGLIERQIDKSTKGVKKLEESGLIIIDRSRRVEELRKKKKLEAEQAKAAKEKEEKKPGAKKAAKKKMTWSGTIYDSIVGVFASIYETITFPYRLIFGSPRAKKKVPQKDAATAKSVAGTLPVPKVLNQTSAVQSPVGSGLPAPAEPALPSAASPGTPPVQQILGQGPAPQNLPQPGVPN